jgi:hypothetical protein
MRCPKCGFISFDHLASCSKCGRDISEVASELQGTSIKVEPPMFLSGALAAFAESEESFEEHAMEDDVAGGIDFNMEMEDEAVEMDAAAEDVDFSFEEEGEALDVAPEEGADFEIVEEEEGADISLAEAEAEEAAGIAEEDVDIELEAEAEDTFEELDFMSSVDEEEEGGLEFDLEDFIEDTDDDETQTSGDADTEGLDLDLDDEKK